MTTLDQKATTARLAKTAVHHANFLEANAGRDQDLRIIADDLRKIADAMLNALPAGGEAEVVKVTALRLHLREHWLTNIICDHDAKTDTAVCSCSRWRDEPHPSVGSAVDAWIDHVLVTLSAAPASPSVDAPKIDASALGKLIADNMVAGTNDYPAINAAGLIGDLISALEGSRT